MNKTRKLLDYADVSQQETRRVPIVVLPTQPIQIEAYALTVARQFAAQDGMSIEAYLARLVYRDQDMRRELAALD